VTVASVRNVPIEGVEVLAMSRSAQPSAPSLAAGYVQLPFAIPHRSADVTHAHYASTNGYAAALARTTPTVLTVWGTDVVPKPGSKLRRTQRHRARVAIEHADAVTSASPFMADAVRSISPDVDPIVVPFGVDTDLFRAIPPNDNADRPIVLVAKNLEDKYGVEFVVRAMQSVTSDHQYARLVVAGDGRRRADLESLTSDLGVDAEFVGRIPHRDLPELMAQAAVIVNPTIVDESFGVVLLEAQAMGRPVVSTDVGNVRNVTDPGTTALLVPPRDSAALASAISSVLRGDQLNSADRAGPRLVADRFGWSNSVDQMEQVLDSVAGR